MCRWFAYISATEDCLLEDALISPKHSLAKQVHDHYLPKLIHHDPNESDERKESNLRNALFNLDGLGVAWYSSAQESFVGDINGGRPGLYKTISPPLNDFNFRSLCINTSTKTCFAHIRAASGTAVTPVNNHPFAFGRHLFMHNGTISNFVDICRDFNVKFDKDSYANVSGSTDSEHLAAMYMTVLTGGKGKEAWETEYSTAEMAHALHEAVGTVIDLQKQILGTKARPNSLNLAVTDGVKLVTYRFRNHKTQQPPSLYYSTTAGITLNRKYPDHANGEVNLKAYKKEEEHGKHIIVASEPSTYKEKEWHLIGKNCCLKAEADGSFEIDSIPYDEHWNVEDDPIPTF